MNCWKSINISRDYGSIRLSMISCISILIFFLFYYLLLSSLISVTQYIEYGILPIILGIPTVILLHKLFHCIPIWLSGNKANIEVVMADRIPRVFCCIPQPLHRNTCILSALFPVLLVTSGCFIGATFSPEHLHYFAIFASINFGMSIYDLMYAYQLTKAPKDSLIEDHREGFHILIKRY
ncbi:DUF3267 domain-containing protein [Bacillus alkalicellulosilyticus]|uniref:DUF3267 domain-containing protein n=1 Tax=Alkalihalobacterium alkalicellulosilyticum TaxID=1912214 RepID=UPI0009972252|nr:DUF3267 domain-containing protein [Bacillus alkalicellulosilyticus]